MEGSQMQQAFFQQINAQLPPNLSLVNEIADVLHISNDSAITLVVAQTGS